MSEALTLGRGGAVMRRLPRPLHFTRNSNHAAPLGTSAAAMRPGNTPDFMPNRLKSIDNRRSSEIGTKLER
jgi:hypothetical protein